MRSHDCICDLCVKCLFFMRLLCLSKYQPNRNWRVQVSLLDIPGLGTASNESSTTCNELMETDSGEDHGSQVYTDLKM